MTVNIKRFFYAAASLALLLCLLIYGAPILKPLVFALLLSVMLMPVQSFIQRVIRSKIASIIITILTVLILIGGIATVFIFQSRDIFSQFNSLSDRLIEVIQDAIEWVNAKTPLYFGDIQEEIFNTGSVGSSVFEFLSSGLSTTVSTVTLLFLTLLFLFFLMLYRRSFTSFLRMQFAENERVKVNNILTNIRHTLVNYLSGLGIVMIIMAVLNSVGLYFIGVENAIFFGVLAALLTIIPYVGTTLGGTLPFLYVIATGGGLFQASMVIVYYFIVQQIEGNFITPKIVGDSVKVNPFVAILGITIGTFIWGIAGIILAIPVLGILRIICEEIDPLKPVAVLLSNDIGQEGPYLLKNYNNKSYRVSSLFKK